MILNVFKQILTVIWTTMSLQKSKVNKKQLNFFYNLYKLISKAKHSDKILFEMTVNLLSSIIKIF